MESEGGTEVWCPYCADFTICKSKDIKRFDCEDRAARSNRLFLGARVGYYRRARTCLKKCCKRTFATVEIEEGAWESAVRLSSLNDQVHRYLELEALASEARKALASAIDRSATDRIREALEAHFRYLQGVRIATAEELVGRPIPPHFELFYPSDRRYLAVKVVGQTDVFADLISDLEEFVRTAKHVWVVDPGRRRFYVYEKGTLKGTKTLSLPDLKININEKDIFDHPKISQSNVIKMD